MGHLNRVPAGRFAVLWLATALAYVTGAITKLLFPLLAADLTRSPFHVSLVAFALMAAVINGCWTCWTTVFVLYAVEPGPMGLSTFEYGLVLTGGLLAELFGIRAVFIVTALLTLLTLTPFARVVTNEVLSAE